MSAIEAKGLTKIYRTYKKRPGLAGAVRGLFRRDYEQLRAADSVTFSIEEGEFVGFLGPNGAGKTTVLKMLSGLLHPTSGTASVLGFTPWERKDGLKRQFALLMGQKNALWWDLPARESLELNKAIYGIAQSDFDKIVNELIDLLDVRDKLNVMVRELSLGERMKMELIAALLHQPRVLFLDEPTIGLDVISQKKVREFLREYNQRRRITTILTSHYMQDIEELCARVLIIDHGKLFFDGPLDEIVDRFAGYKILTFTFAGATAPDLSIHGTILENRFPVVTLQVERTQVADVCRKILAEFAINDMEVSEVPIEQVISEIFAEAEPIAT
ncbi:MAG TPA: ATP-binding cassette domain-containing protein [Chthoniobacterales bacterium]